MLRLGKQGETDRLGDQIVAALHDKGRRVVRPLGHACIRADAFRARARASASVRIGVDPSVLGRMWCLLGKVSQGRTPLPRGPPWPLSTYSPPSRTTAKCRHACSICVSAIAECYHCSYEVPAPPGGSRTRPRARGAR